MSWVDVEVGEAWIKHHALHSTEAQMALDGTYTFGTQHNNRLWVVHLLLVGLLTPATIVSTPSDSEICPKHHDDEPTTSTDATTTHTTEDSTYKSVISELPTATPVINTIPPTTESSKTKISDKADNSAHIFTSESKDQHSPVNGISIASLVLLTGILAMLMVIGMLCLLWRRYPPRKRHGRYKNFLPMSLRSDTGGIAIPTIGIPRSNNRAEAEILIPDDDDDV